MPQGALPSHTLMFIFVYRQYRYCMIFVLLVVYMSVFESPLHPSTRMERDQMYYLSSPDLREDALDDMMCRIHLQSDDPDLFEQEAERDQLQQ